MSDFEGHTDNPTALRVLVAEEGSFNQRVASSLLEKLGYESVVVNDGVMAVEQLSKSEFEIALMDVRLLDERTTRQLAALQAQQEAAGRCLTIIALTESTEVAIDPIVDHVVVRPLRAGQLSTALEESQRPAAATVINWKEALDRVEGRASLLAELIEIFLIEHPKIMTKIGQAISDQDAKNLQVHSHGMKGCLRYFGRTAAADYAARLEDIGKSGQVSQAAAVREDLSSALELLVPELQRYLEEGGVAGS